MYLNLVLEKSQAFDGRWRKMGLVGGFPLIQLPRQSPNERILVIIREGISQKC
jgi:hypothetical protein